MAFMTFNMGTSMNVKQLVKEWKILVMSCFAMVVAFIGVIAVSPIIGMDSALVSIPIVNGGILATQIMTEGALAKGATMAAALGAVIFAIQKFVGTIPASICGRKEAKALSDEFRSSLAKGINLWEVEAEGTTGDDGKPAKVPFWKKHEKYYTAYVTLGIGAIVGGLCAQTLAKITGLNYAIWGIVLGVICNQLGIVPPNLMDKGKSSGVWMMACFCSIIPSLGNVSLSDLATLLFQTIVVFAAVLVVTFLVFYVLPGWKFVGSKNLAIGVAMAQLLGFPATMLIVNEVATAAAETEDEKNYIVKKLTPAFVISGFVSVSTLSGIIAGVVVGFL